MAKPIGSSHPNGTSMPTSNPSWNASGRHSDPRPPISDYSIVTLGLRRSSLIKNVDLAIYARNLLDEDAREPSESAISLPFDVPFAGRSIFGEISVRF